MVPATKFKPLYKEDHEKQREAEEEILKADRHRFGMSEEEREALCQMMEQALKVSSHAAPCPCVTSVGPHAAHSFHLGHLSVTT